MLTVNDMCIHIQQCYTQMNDTIIVKKVFYSQNYAVLKCVVFIISLMLILYDIKYASKQINNFIEV